MRLKYQLFIILLVASAALIAALFVFNSWSFNRGFLNYINRSQLSSLETLSSNLAEGYAEQNSWDWITENPRQWHRWANNTLRNAERAPNEGTDLAQNTDSPKKRSPPPVQLVLADAEKSILVGRTRSNQSLQWIPINLNGVTVGQLGYAQPTRLPGQVEQVFADQQRRSFALASVLMVALSAVLAALLASRIVKPVINISKVVGEINHGDYTQRIASSQRDELGDLSRNVNQLANTLEHSRTARRKWIAEISHELRTPVAILQGEVEAIKDGIRPFNDESLASLHAETLRLSRLISDLHDLSLSDLGALAYQMAPMDLLALLQQRLVTAASLLAEKNLTIDLQTDADAYPIMGDTQRLGQLLDNLLQNSVRYTNPGGSVAIQLSRLNGRIHLQWSDSKPGVSDQDLPNLFDTLYRVEQSRNRRDGGSGLGLAIVQKIVLAHQGVISASHSHLGGIQITMDFPENDSVGVESIT